ncbi:MAG: response regulator [Mojavia pulchra JT2-VF2]|uniref:Circadian input-output histidine kinase CikA n=1 Tax=Mojavia pulchra JT2-VF2 TaxID=287848 RepID=A0A951Q4S0_9NOST|nr:response regulator [Mojavia pulchra JT2-VF2]
MKNESTSVSNADVSFLLGGGEMGARMHELDWSTTSLGPTQLWPQSLKTAVRIMLTSRQPMFVWWGEELINLYNDAYQAIIGGKHPQALGQPASYVWREIWDQVGPRAESAMLKNEGTYDEALLLIMERNDYPEETYYTFSYSPVPNDQGDTGGIICANTDDTQRIIGERQLALLRELAARTADARTFNEACTLSVRCLETNPYDLPFAMIYLVDPDQQQVFLAGTCGIDRNHVAVPETVALDSDAIWPFAEVIKTHQVTVFSDLETSFSGLPTGAWQRSPHQAVAVPIAPSGQTGKAGILIAGLNPFRLFDDNYKGFIDLVAAQIAASIANAQAYEEERKRAEALAELDRAKTVFFSNVSHEFRTPLTLMLGPLEETLTNCAILLPPNEREQLEMVQRNGLRLLKLVNTLLDFSRIEAGRVQASYEPTDLASFTAELASVFRSAVEQAGMQLSVNCPPLPAPVYVDREMWEKIVLNLLSNAFKFTFAGKIAVSLQWSNDRVEFAVEDTGIGIPSTEIPYLFERFHRVKGAQGRSFEGSGIGLSLVQELVRMHGGTVEVTSVLGEGSCFTVSIPTGSAHLPQERITASRTLASTALGASPYLEEALRWLPEEGTGDWGQGTGKKQGSREQEAGEKNFPNLQYPIPNTQSPIPNILLADDNADMRDYVKRLLSQQYEVEAVPDGLAALSSARGRIPDLVLTDVMMPGLDGFGLLQELRADPQTRKVPIILLSARAGEEARVEALEAGADDYLIKPFSARELLARVEAALKMARLRQEAMQREQGLRIEAEVAKAHLETVLAGIQDQFFVLDQECSYIFVNDRVAEVVGKSKEELLGKNIWEMFPDVVGSEFYTQVHRAMAQQTVVRFEYFYPPWQRWFENRVYPFAEGVSVFVTDINDRKIAEEALREAHVQLKSALAAGAVYTWRWKISEDCLITDAALSRLFAVDPVDAAKGLPLQMFVNAIHKEDQSQVLAAINRAIETGEEYIAEYRIHTATGEERWVAARGIVEYDSAGKPVAFPGALADITEHKQTQTALREAEERLRLALESAELGTWDFNPITGELRWDECCKAMFGIPTDAVVTYDIFLAGLHPDDRDRTDQVVQSALNPASGGEYNIEYRTVGITDGVERWIAAQGKAFFNAAGAAVRFIGTVLNITARKQAETEREQLLKREQAAREAAEAANRIKDEFLAVLSHELRSPLNPIIGWTKLLQTREFDSAGLKKAITTIERNAKLQAQLIEDLLDVSRILQGKLNLNMAPVNLAPVIEAALETVRLAAEAKDIQIQTILDNSLGRVLGDSGRLQQVIWNLLSNAVKFTPEGGKIEIQLERIDTQAQITVSDTGKGINPDFLPYVFEYFRQADSTTTRKFGGLGLGLAIVRHLIELHGGTAGAESLGEGQGAIFTVRLPLIKKDLTPTKQVNITAVNTSPMASILTGIQILVVDDDADTRDLHTFLLEEAGASVTAVASATQALQVLAESKPDVLLSDIGMPQTDGYMLMQQVKALLKMQNKQIPAIALTAYAGESNQQQALESGFQKHLSKPIEPEELVMAIATLVGRSDNRVV